MSALQLALRRAQPSEAIVSKEWIAERHYLKSAPPGFGGESGAGARPLDLAWARHMVGACQEAGVAVFVKQLGFNPRCESVERNGSEVLPGGALQPVLQLHDRKGGDMAEWPDDLRVREFPRMEG